MADNNTLLSGQKLKRENELLVFKKKSEHVSRPSEHPPVRGGDVKTFRWDHRLQVLVLLQYS